MTDQPTETPTEQVRVPNIHSHAVSGLDHTPLGDDDRDALDVTSDDSAGEGTEPGVALAEPEELPDMTGAVAGAETSDDTSGSQADTSDAPEEPQEAAQEPDEGDGGTGDPTPAGEGLEPAPGGPDNPGAPGEQQEGAHRAD